jgi:hypothetical protein
VPNEVILIVDSDFEWALLTAAQLTMQYKLESFSASTSREARQLFNAYTPQIVVMNITTRLVREFRSGRPMGNLIAIPSEEEDQNRMVELGATHLCDKDKVIDKIFTVLGRPKPERQ